MLDIDAVAVGAWAERVGLAFASHQELAVAPEVYDLLTGCVEAVNRDLAADRDLAAQVIGRFLILPKPLDADDGELTRMRKIRRAVIAERYAALIEGLYSGRDRARLSMRISFDDGRESSLDVEVAIRMLRQSAVAQ